MIHKKLLLTGFEPFNDYKLNPSWEIAKSLNEETVGNFKVFARQIPVKYKEIYPTIKKFIDEIKPDAIINLGQSGRDRISIERVAINIADVTGVAYNCGSKPVDEILFDDGPVAYFSTLPIKKMKDAVAQAGIPVEISNTAGTYGCNQLMYTTLYILDKSKIKIPAGFIHVPSLPEQAVKRRIPSMSLDLMVKAIRIVISVIE